MPLSSISTRVRIAEYPVYNMSLKLTLPIENAHFIFAVLRSQKRFYATRDLMVDGAQEQLDRHVRARKDRNDGQQQTSSSRRASGDGLRSSTNVQGPPLSNVPENDDAFAIGDDDESEDGERVKPESERSPSISEDPSRAASIVSSNDDAVPAQVHSMSEKARGKLRAGHTSFSRQGSSASLNNLAMMVPMTNVSFEPTEAWVRYRSYYTSTTNTDFYYEGRQLASRSSIADYTHPHRTTLSFVATTTIIKHFGTCIDCHTTNSRRRLRAIPYADPPLRVVTAFVGLVRVSPLGLHLRKRGDNVQGCYGNLERDSCQALSGTGSSRARTLSDGAKGGSRRGWQQSCAAHWQSQSAREQLGDVPQQRWWSHQRRMSAMLSTTILWTTTKHLCKIVGGIIRGIAGAEEAKEIRRLVERPHVHCSIYECCLSQHRSFEDLLQTMDYIHKQYRDFQQWRPFP